MKAMKYDDEKVRMELLPPVSLERIAEVFTYGAVKYDDWNWANSMKASRLYGALMRHMNAWYQGENLDPESGLPHLAHAGCCIMMLLDSMELHGSVVDDRPKKIYYGAVGELVKFDQLKVNQPHLQFQQAMKIAAKVRAEKHPENHESDSK